MDKRWDLTVALVFIAIGVWFLWVAGETYSKLNWDPMKEGTVPRITAGMIVVGGLMIVIERLVKWRSEKGWTVEAIGETDEPGHPVSVKRSLAISALFVFYIIAWPYLGYVLTTALVLGLSLFLFGIRSWKRLIAIPVGTAVVLYVVFALFFQLPLSLLPGG